MNAFGETHEEYRDRVEYEVRSRFPAKWNETAPATCSTVEEEVRAVLQKIDREAAAKQGALT